MAKSNLASENERLAMKYRPLLVLYPEIEDGSERKKHHHPIGDRLGTPPLDQDYHPRDIRLVLDYVYLRGGQERPSRDQVLDALSENSIDHIDIIDQGGPKDVDKFWRVYAGIHDRKSNPEYQRRAYARVVRGSPWFKDYISIQYWMAYFFDDWANVHEMDWEAVSVILKKTDTGEEPVACVFNAHIGGFRMLWKKVQKADDNGNKDPEGLHPIAYIANGSHASYFSDYPPYFSVAASYLKSVLRTVVRIIGIAKPFTDFVRRFEDTENYFPEVDVIPEPDKNGRWSGDWRWLNYQGKWGSPKELSPVEWLISKIPLIRRLPLFFQRPLRESGPRGPNTRGVCWENPLDWVNLECFDAQETKPWIYKIHCVNSLKKGGDVKGDE